ncbi:hypothetical protein CROQUDRAFT_690625 [Cronartium quercuum f. sp. fusiforme G11]|uniref:Uncharacterized protein n=1 Tax=Cronartium quercuum f. sp. fusiforme G11 TaxID=708437 RepID=A0A9P6T6C5_9BASI|nr:hypothetical protein CROQUDRAFT_690625 [Cronartium quercuum f. sp. fusiforme G11]
MEFFLSKGLTDRIPLKAFAIYTVWSTKQKDRETQMLQQMERWIERSFPGTPLNVVLRFVDKRQYLQGPERDIIKPKTYISHKLEDAGVDIDHRRKTTELSVRPINMEECFNIFSHDIPFAIHADPIKYHENMSEKFLDQEEATKRKVKWLDSVDDVQGAPVMDFSIYVVWATKQESRRRRIVDNLLEWESQSPNPSSFGTFVDYALNWIYMRDLQKAKNKSVIQLGAGKPLEDSDLISVFNSLSPGYFPSNPASIAEAGPHPSYAECCYEFSRTSSKYWTPSLEIPQEYWYDHKRYHEYLDSKFEEFERKVAREVNYLHQQESRGQVTFHGLNVYIVWAKKQTSKSSRIIANLDRWQSKASKGSPLSLALKHGKEWIKNTIKSQ